MTRWATAAAPPGNGGVVSDGVENGKIGWLRTSLEPARSALEHRDLGGPWTPTRVRLDRVQFWFGRYMWRDLERLCEKYDLPWRRPSIFPRSSVLAARVACLCGGGGAPDLVAAGELCFGQDRLDDAIAWEASRGSPLPART